MDAIYSSGLLVHTKSESKRAKFGMRSVNGVNFITSVKLVIEKMDANNTSCSFVQPVVHINAEHILALQDG